LETGERYSCWGRDPDLRRWVADHSGDLFISHNLIAEAKYLLRLGIAPPPLWWDTMLGWRFVSNAEYVPEYGLTKALVANGLPHAYSDDDKGELQKWIGELRFDPSDPEHRRQIRDYCLTDCAAAARLYRRLVARVPACWMRYVTEFCLELARMELRGIGLDMGRYGALLERRDEVVREVTGKVNATHPVFVNGQLSRRRFLAWCARNGVGWPTSVSKHTGRKGISLDRRTFERMKNRHPFIQATHEANKTAKQLNNRTLTVDPVTGRHHFGNVPVGTSTGRTSFKGFLFSVPRWMRFLAVPRSPEHVLVSVDFEAEEILIAAALSHDAEMLAGYTNGDAHMSFAIRAGAAPEWATKDTHRAVRKKYKIANLAVAYGQTAFGLAENTGMHFQEARDLLAQHRRVYSTYAAWSDAYTTRAFRLGRCETIRGWPRQVSRTDNPRSVANFPVQGAGGDLMRLAVVYLSRCGLRLLATNHDGFLLEALREDLPLLREAVDAALSLAVNQVFPGIPMRWTTDVFTDRYRDEDGEDLWHLVDGILTGRKGALAGVG
jgi:DNA polymerase I-like protein with 3'-5' exonuclease and polymerase domains